MTVGVGKAFFYCGVGLSNPHPTPVFALVPLTLAVSQIFAMLHANLKIWDSCAKIFFLLPPQAAVKYFAPRSNRGKAKRGGTAMPFPPFKTLLIIATKALNYN